MAEGFSTSFPRGSRNSAGLSHASAAYVSSLDPEEYSVVSPPPQTTCPRAARWKCLEDCLSRSVDQAVLDEVCSSASDTPWPSLLQSPMLETGYHLKLLAYMGNQAVCSTGWASGWWRRSTNALFASLMLMLMVTTRLIMEEWR